MNRNLIPNKQYKRGATGNELCWDFRKVVTRIIQVAEILLSPNLHPKFQILKHPIILHHCFYIKIHNYY